MKVLKNRTRLNKINRRSETEETQPHKQCQHSGKAGRPSKSHAGRLKGHPPNRGAGSRHLDLHSDYPAIIPQCCERYCCLVEPLNAWQESCARGSAYHRREGRTLPPCSRARPASNISERPELSNKRHPPQLSSGNIRASSISGAM
jgi:hypothetical protein